MRLDELRLDLRYLMASVRRSKAFFATTILTFGLGIGVTTAMVSATYGVLVRPLPYPQSGRLVQLWEEHPGSPTNPAYPPMANTTFYAWRARLQSLEMIGLFGRRDFTVRLGDESFRLQGAEVSPAIFDILRATPQRGRFFIPADDVPGHHDFVVLSDRLWRDRFNASSDIVGQSIDVDGRLHTIVGIAGPGFAFPADGTLMWTPFDDPTLTDPKTQGGVWMGNALGRMRAGVTAEAVASEGTAAARSIPRPPVLEALLGKGGPVEMHARPLIAQQTDAVRPAMLVLLAGVVIVLLVGCANVANLMLARGLARERELGVRVALGASRERLLRQLVTENGVLAAAGGVAGLLFAAGLIAGGRILAGPSIPRLNDVSVDGTTISIAMALSIAVAMVAGLWPAWRATSMNIAVALRGADGATADGFRSRASHELRRLLLIGETALAVLLLVVASLIGRSFFNLLDVDPGYSADGVLTIRAFAPQDAKPPRLGQFMTEMLSRLRGDGRVMAAGAGNMMPFSDSITIAAFDIPGSVGNGANVRTRAVYYIVTPGYAEALGLRLRAGRHLNAGDATFSDVRRVVVSDEFVRQYLSPDRVIGLQLPPRAPGLPRLEIVGVVATQRQAGNDQPTYPEIYVAATPAPAIGPEVDFVIKAPGNAIALSETVRAMARDIDPTFVIGETMTLENRLGESVRQPRFATALLSALGVVTLLLAAVGVYGVLSYSVSQRRREMSVRAALGAGRRRLLMMVIFEGLTVAAMGAAIGLGVASLLTQLLSAMLFGITPLDPASFVAAPLMLLPVVVLACLIPAAIAARSDPAQVLRQ